MLQRETELQHAGSHAYFHFLVSDFLRSNRSLGVFGKMAQLCSHICQIVKRQKLLPERQEKNGLSQWQQGTEIPI